MNPVENYRNKTPEEKNQTYITTVMICIFLCVLLCLTMLSMVFPEDHTIQKNRSTNADSAASEISAGLLIRSEDTLSSALTYVETYYTTTPSEKRSELAAKRFAQLFYEEMRETAGVKANAKERKVTSGEDTLVRVKVPAAQLKSGSDNGKESFADYLESLTLKKRNASIATDGAAVYIAYSKSDHYVEIQNLKIVCKDGSSTKVKLRFTAPKDVVGDSVGNYAGAVNSYAVVADGDIISTGGVNRISGSVYSGGSIQAQSGGELNINGDRTVARSEIASSGSALLSIDKGEVWTQNLRTASSSGASGSYSAGMNMDIAADCFLSGDLILENAGYSVQIDGNYYGYGTQEKTDDGKTVDTTTENKLSGTEMDTILQRLLAGAYTVLTDENGTTTIISDEARAAAEAEATKIASEAAMEAGGSTIRITGSGAKALVAYSSGQTLWLAATDYYESAPKSGRSAITADNVPNGMGSGKKDSNASNMETLYTYQFNGLTTALDKNASTSSPSWKLVKHLLKISGLKGKTAVFTENKNGKYEIHSLDTVKGSSGEYVAIMPKSEYHEGVLVADCDVRIANTEFNGIILSTGNITMTGGAEVNSNPADVRFTGVTENLQKEKNQDDSESRVTASVISVS